MKDAITPQLLRKFLKRECTAEEEARVRAWYNSFETEPDPLDFLSVEERKELSKRMFEQILHNLQDLGELPSSPKVVKVSWWYYAASGIAAMLLMAIGWVLLNKDGSNTYSGQQVAVSNERVVTNDSKAIQRELLPDGSSIWLQPNSSIRYSADFKNTTREVRMSGEAFFDVAKDPNRPFIIYTGDVVTQVLGTSFNIRESSDASSVEVAVVTGKVRVRRNSANKPAEQQEELVLLPSEKAVYQESGDLLMKELITNGTHEPVRIWEKTSVSFDNIPVREVIKVLNKSFGVSIRVETPELNNFILKADFSDQNLPDILQMLEKSLNVKYELNGNVILLKTAIPNS